MKKRIKFGIIGCGVIADFHANAIMEIPNEAELVGVTDVIYDAAEKFSKRHGIKAFATLDEMLSSKDIDVVNICTPSGYHAEVVIKAARAKKHIIVEKPMAITKEQLDSIEQACEENGIILSSISQNRFSRGVRMTKKAVEDGMLGRIVCADIYMKYNRTQEYYDSGSWRGTKRIDGGGALMNQGIHGVDLLQYIAGPIKSVYAVSKTLVRKIEVEDTLSAVVDFESGATGVIQATTSVFPGYPRRLEINGDKGSIALEETSIVRWDIDNSKYEDIVLQPAMSSSASTPTAISTDGHTRQILDVIRAIKTKTKPLIDVNEGRKSVDIILAIYKSAEEKRTIFLVE
ncbi:MAG: oxidoreductase [Firmicutes bacterium HGW-Firmicutes-21]|nr:MAG: oxidoreductase [Firmicutes bacterium HGW-Firmicutes-21]